MTNPADLGVAEASAALGEGALSSVELTDACLERVAQRDGAFGAWSGLYEDLARAGAREADRRRATGDVTPLLGFPVGLKASIGAAGLPLTGDSALLEGNVAAEDATAWRRLREAGMVLLGHLHCGELGCGSYGRNPWNPAFSPGGSSSGGGIALAERTVPATIGSDGRGSIREPSGFNGVTGLKPSFGLVSTAGHLPVSPSYDTVGPMARGAVDCSLLLQAMAGPDPADPISLMQPPVGSFPTASRPGAQPLAGMRLGVPGIDDGALAAGVAAVLERFHEELESLGATLVPFERPFNPLDAGDYCAILSSEAAISFAQFAGREHLHRRELEETFQQVRERAGSAVDYLRAQIQRGELVATWRAIFAENRLDAVIEPATLGEIWRVDWPTDLDANMGFYGMWNDVSFPVLMMPAGVSPTDGGPLGMQVVGLPFHDATVLQIGIDYQAATDYHRVEPPGLADVEALGHYVPPHASSGAGPQSPFEWPRHPFHGLFLR